MSRWADFIGAAAAFMRNPFFSITRRFEWTGYQEKTMVKPVELNAAQDIVFADKRYWPKDIDGDEITYCNTATLAVTLGVGCHALDRASNLEPYTADGLYTLFQNSGKFAQQPMKVCQKLVNNGALIFAILPSWKLHQGHGHVCTLTPGVGDHSGRWDVFTPLCMNLGRAGTCFRARGVNWAFQMVPEFYSWGI